MVKCTMSVLSHALLGEGGWVQEPPKVVTCHGIVAFFSPEQQYLPIKLKFGTQEQTSGSSTCAKSGHD